VAETRYPQFCALARAAEVLGERWTLLIVRELLLGPKRFSDLRERLDGISPSVLTERLGRAEDLALVRRTIMPPPAASTVYELTEHGEALRPAVHELIRWGGRFLHPRRARERVELDWTRLALTAVARRGAAPARTFVLRVRDGRAETVLTVTGGRAGTRVEAGERGDADATLTLDVATLLAVAGGHQSPAHAVKSGAARVSGDVGALEDLPRLFDS
jgi:DNA-binding HxlR family transcriptional regulator